MHLHECGLGVVYIMDHDVITCSPKICDWQLDMLQDCFGLRQGKNVTMIMKFEVPKRPFLHAYIIHYHGSMNFVMIEAKKFSHCTN